MSKTPASILESILETTAPGVTLFLSTGLPATGKTRLCRMLAEELACPLLQTDQLVQAFLGGGMAPGVEEKLTDWTADLVGWYLSQGYSVILDGRHLRRATRQPFLELARGLRVQVHGLWVMCSPEVQAKRLGTESRIKLAQQCLDAYEPPLYMEGFTQLTSYTSEPLPVPKRRDLFSFPEVEPYATC